MELNLSKLIDLIYFPIVCIILFVLWLNLRGKTIDFVAKIILGLYFSAFLIRFLVQFKYAGSFEEFLVQMTATVMIWCSLFILIQEMSRLKVSLKATSHIEYYIKAKKVRNIRNLLIILQLIVLCLNFFSQITQRDLDFYERYKPFLIFVMCFNCCIQFPTHTTALTLFLLNIFFFSAKSKH